MTIINIFDIYQKIVSAVNVQQSGQIRPVSDFQNWMNEINSEYFNECCEAYQLYQMNSDMLSPFTVRVNVLVTPVPGQPYDRINLSGVTNYEYLKGIRIVRNLLDEADLIQPDGKCVKYTDPDFAALITQYAGKNKYEGDVQVINSDRWSGRLDSITKKPTFQKPLCTQDSQGFLLAPKGIYNVVLEYFRTPRKCIFAYTVGTGDIIVYNAGGSTQLEWSNIVENEFISRLIKKYGLRVRDEKVFQAGDMDKKELK